jgi:hypothetical protein
VFVIRDPVDVCLSRHSREQHDVAFNDEARRRLLLDFRSRSLTYTSSWRQGIETYRRLRDAYPDDVDVLYYDDLVEDQEPQLDKLFAFLGVPMHPQVLEWHTLPHHAGNGTLQKDLKYPDRPIHRRSSRAETSELPDELREALATIERDRELWAARRI